MPQPSDRSIRIDLRVNSSHPHLLEGLQIWLDLGLVSDAQIRQLCQDYLTCPLPQAVSAPAEQTVSLDRVQLPSTGPGRFITPPPEKTPRVAEPLAASSPSQFNAERSQSAWWVSRMLQSLMAELSVVWLLCIGVFLVVVSSAVLAATQWERFDAAGQYGVLWVYTLALWGGCEWARRQPKLRLTARTLQFVTLLLIPVNFWAMDQLQLWQSFLGTGVAIAAAVILTGIVIQLYGNRQLQATRLCQVAFLGGSFLQWGWELLGMPWSAVYAGTVGGVAALVYQTHLWRSRASSSPAETDTVSSPPPLNRATLIVIYGVAVLLLRMVLVPHVELAQISGALGLCGWIIGWLVQQTALQTSRELSSATAQSASNSSLQGWGCISGLILLFAWLMGVGDAPEQAIAVSIFALHLVWRQLTANWQRLDLALLLTIGLQLIWLIWRVIPEAQQQIIVATATQWTGTEAVPEALLGIAFLPYVACIVGLTGWLHQRRSSLARFGEGLGVLLGLVLTLISALNQTTWAINLVVSTLLLGRVTQRQRSPRRRWIYATHILGLVAIAAVIHLVWPNLPPHQWATVLLALMVVEWIFSRGQGFTEWRRSSWWLGFGLAGLSYWLLLVDELNAWFLSDAGNQWLWGLLWLISPATLTGLGSRAAPRRWAQASTVALCLAPPLTLLSPTARLISWGLSAGLMVVNTYELRSRWAGRITVGFALGWIGWLLVDNWLGVQPQSLEAWFLVGAIAVFSLWLGRFGLQQAMGTDRNRFAQYLQPYAQAADDWGIGLTSLLLIGLTLSCAALYLNLRQVTGIETGAIALLILALLSRSWRHPTDLSIYTLAWSTELLLAASIRLSSGDLLDLAIANSGLGLITLLLGGWWRSQRSYPDDLTSLRSLPLLYALFGVVLRLGSFTAWTGALSLAAGIVGVEVGRRNQQRALKWIALLGLSLGWYELVLYPLLQAETGQIADGYILLASVAVVIMGIYRLLGHWIARRLDMARDDLSLLAHLHWGIGTILLVLSVGPLLASGVSLKGVAIALGLSLSAYAIEQGRRWSPVSTSRDPSPEAWIYLGLLQLAGMGLYARLLWPELKILGPWLGAIAAGVALLIDQSPWARWGWPVRPWQQFVVILPIGCAIATSPTIHSVSLVVAAGFYLWLAYQTREIRLTYLSVLLADWLIWRSLFNADITDPVVHAIPLSLSLLYLAQIDPFLRQPTQRQNRHYLRLFSIGLIHAVALLSNRWSGIPLGILSLLTLFGGLALRVRALLYIGTLVFILNAINQLVLLNTLYPFTKWIIGIVVGSSLIWIAASFETRREQVVTLVRDWSRELETWD